MIDWEHLVRHRLIISQCKANAMIVRFLRIQSKNHAHDESATNHEGFNDFLHKRHF